MRKLNDEPWREDIESGGDALPCADGAGMPESIIEAHRYICNEDGGHLVDRNPCPKHHGPTTPYGD